MRPLPALPGSSFRIITLAVLAVVTVGGTMINFDVDPGAAAGTDSTAPGEPEASTPPVTTVPSIEFGAEQVSEVTTTLAPDTTGSGLDDADVATDGEALETSDGAQLAPVSGVPVVVADPTDGADIQLLEPEVTDPDDVASCALAESVPVSNAAAGVLPAASTPATGTWFVDDFANGADAWTPLSGAWAAVDGAYVQSDGQGYDFISQLPIDLPSEYRIAVDMTPVEDAIGGGILVGQPVLGSRRGATLIDFTDGGNFLRWGVYDSDTGQYRYIGGLATDGDFDPLTTHRLAIEVRATRTMVVLDGRAVGDFDPIAPGRAGLATSLSALSFDNIEIVEL